jgi:Raf kinase inhibitor-like YbhB/YbcL family protein
MKVKSTFENGEMIPIKFTADGENVNPELRISEIPRGTKSILLIVEDPDAKKVAGFNWIHWVVFDIPVNSDEILIKENSVSGILGKTSSGKKDYSGPSPPKGSGTHHYHFKFFAVDKFLDLPEMSSVEEIKEKIARHVLGEADLVGTYKR